MKVPFEATTGVLIPYVSSMQDWPLRLDGKPVDVEWIEMNAPMFKVLRYSGFKRGVHAHLVLCDAQGNTYRMFLEDLGISLKKGFHVSETLEGFWSIVPHRRNNSRGDGYWFGLRFEGSCPPKKEDTLEDLRTNS